MVGSRLSDSACEVFTALAELRKATRPQLAIACGLSKPTVSTAMAEMEAIRLVERNGTAHGPTGRSAAVYQLGPDAGYVLAVDRGAARVAYRAVGLDGQVLDENHTDEPSTAHVMIRTALRRRTRSGPLRAVVVAVPDVVTPSGRDGDPVIDQRIRAVVDALHLPPGVEVRTENNVNCAAIAELHAEPSRLPDTFVYLRVDVGIGAGVVVNGQLIRGSTGAAGEVARIAYPWADGVPTSHKALEARLGSSGLLGRVRSRWSPRHGPVPDSATALFALAEKGHSLAAELVAEHADEVGKLAVAISAVLDPGLLILGGGVGGNPLLTDGVAATLARIGLSTEVTVSSLREQATVLGATRLAMQDGVRTAILTAG